MRSGVAGLALAALLVSACGSGTPDIPAADDAVSGSGVGGHVHHVALSGDDLLLGTHDGLWRQAPGEAPERVSEPPFDVMGLALAGERVLASGHPGPGMDAPADLGLIASGDGGATWRSVSLSGEVDFHRLTAAGDVVMGVAAADGALLRSEDAGSTWRVLTGVPAFDVAIDPQATDAVVVSTQEGPIASIDGGSTWTALTGAPVVGLLAWTDGILYGADAAGTVHASRDAGRTWQARGTLPSPAAALAADGDRVLAYVGGTVVESVDGGRTFLARVTDLPR